MTAALRTLAAPEFDLATTLASGQVFHWVREGAGFAGAIGETAVYVEQAGERLRAAGGKPGLVENYFALDHPLAEIHASFPDDPAMAAALAHGRGLRVIRQPAWECLATFITSSMKQVAHIAQISHVLRRRFGRRLEWHGPEMFAYPAAERIAGSSEAELRGCALGYRAANLLKTARMIAAGEADLEAIRALPDEEARAALMRFPGVGEKVANCVLLFAYERVRAFPIDVWIERVLRETYFKRKRKITAARLREFSRKYFGEFGGYAQQYLFHHARSQKRQAKSRK